MKNPRILAILAVILFAFTSATPAWASGVVVLLSKENRIYQLIFKGMAGAFPSAPEVVLLGGSEHNSGLNKTLHEKAPDVLVAVGDEAARWAMAEWKDSPLLLAGVVDAMLPAKDNKVSGVSLNLPPDTYFKLIRDFLPSARRIGTIYSTLVQPGLGKSLQASAARQGLQIDAVRAATNRDFVLSLRNMEHHIDAFLVLFDPLVLTPEAFQYLTQFSLSQDVPLIVPAFVLLKSGGVLSLEVDYEALGRQVADLAKGLLAKSAPSNDLRLYAPDRWLVGVNLRVGRALNITIPPNAVRKADRVYE